MFIGKWNRSVILTYFGMGMAILGMYFSIFKSIENALSCLIISGVCDLFDGMVARRVKRTPEEKEFGVQIDSLVDIINFMAQPIVLFIGIGFADIAFIPLYIFYAICGVARLAYFNLSTQNEENITHYTGLPVTFIALILPLGYLIKYIIPIELFNIIFPTLLFLTGILHILNIKVAKPKGIMYIIFLALAISTIIAYQVVLK